MKFSCGKMKCLRKCMPCLRRIKKAGVPDPCCVPVTLKSTARIISAGQIGIGFITLIMFSFVSVGTAFTSGILPSKENPNAIQNFSLFFLGIIFYIILSVFLLDFTTKKRLNKWITWVFMLLSLGSYVILHIILIRLLFDFFGPQKTAIVGLLVVFTDIFHVYAAWVVIAFMCALKKGVTEEVEYPGPISGPKKAPEPEPVSETTSKSEVKGRRHPSTDILDPILNPKIMPKLSVEANSGVKGRRHPSSGIPNSSSDPKIVPKLSVDCNSGVKGRRQPSSGIPDSSLDSKIPAKGSIDASSGAKGRRTLSSGIPNSSSDSKIVPKVSVDVNSAVKGRRNPSSGIPGSSSDSKIPRKNNVDSSTRPSV